MWIINSKRIGSFYFSNKGSRSFRMVPKMGRARILFDHSVKFGQYTILDINDQMIFKKLKIVSFGCFFF